MRIPMFPTLLVFALIAACGTTSPPNDAAVDARPMFTPRMCGAAYEASIGPGHACTRVGATVTATAGEWPDTTAAAAPIVFVRAGSVGGNGSMASPFGDIAAALAAMPAPGTVAIARGAYPLAAPLRLSGAIALLGTGPTGGTTLNAANEVTAITVAASATVTLAGLAIHHNAATMMPPEIGIDVANLAVVTIRDVAIDGGSLGITTVGAVVIANELTVRNTGSTAIGLDQNSRGIFTDLLVRDGFNGIVTVGSHIHITRGLIMENQRAGLNMTGVPNASGGARSCGAMPDLTQPTGAFNCLSYVEVLCDAGQGLSVNGAIQLDLRRVSVSGTRGIAGMGRGFGLRASGGATVSIDTDIMSVDQRGQGSEFVGNVSLGIVAQGGGTRLTMHGALVASNGGGGVYLGESAVAMDLRFNRIADNSAVGVAVTQSATLMMFGSNAVEDTRQGTVMAGGMLSQDLGDGLAVAMGSGPVNIVQSDFSRNARFPVMLAAVSGQFVDNTGTGNRFGVGLYNSPGLTQMGNSIEGRESPPTSPGVVVDPSLAR